MSEGMIAFEPREEMGKAAARRMRRTGRVPAVIYGEIEKYKQVSVDSHELMLALKQDHALLNLTKESEKHRVIVREIQRHPVKDTIIHVDFLKVKKGQKLTLSVPLKFEGRPLGVLEGGMLDEVRNEVEIEVLPKDIPNFIEINIDNLTIGDSLRVKDIVSENFTILTDEDSVICRCEVPRGMVEEEAVEGEEEELDEEMAEPEVITAKDKDDEGGE